MYVLHNGRVFWVNDTWSATTTSSAVSIYPHQGTTAATDCWTSSTSATSSVYDYQSLSAMQRQALTQYQGLVQEQEWDAQQVYREQMMRAQQAQAQQPVPLEQQRTERRAWLAQQQREQERELRQKHEKEANDRALQLLLSQLTPEQRKTFEENKWFIVEGGNSKTRYRIRNNGHVAANIEVLDGERVKHRLCGHCRVSDVPLGDHLLAQKLMLEYSEVEFLTIANRH